MYDMNRINKDVTGFTPNLTTSELAEMCREFYRFKNCPRGSFACPFRLPCDKVTTEDWEHVCNAYIFDKNGKLKDEYKDLDKKV